MFNKISVKIQVFLVFILNFAAIDAIAANSTQDDGNRLEDTPGSGQPCAC